MRPFSVQAYAAEMGLTWSFVLNATFVFAQNCSERVNIVVSRQRFAHQQSDIIANQWATDKTLPRFASKV